MALVRLIEVTPEVLVAELQIEKGELASVRYARGHCLLPSAGWRVSLLHQFT